MVFLRLPHLSDRIASVAVVTDSSILVVGAMVVGPEFAAVAAIALGPGIPPGLIQKSALLLLKGFAVAIAVTAVLALLARAAAGSIWPMSRGPGH